MSLIFLATVKHSLRAFAFWRNACVRHFSAGSHLPKADVMPKLKRCSLLTPCGDNELARIVADFRGGAKRDFAAGR
jgi:hypothetical protein